MKKLLLSLVCIGSILALPGCWCCRRTCEPICEERCDDYDDYCDEGHRGCKEDYYDRDDRGGKIVETQQGRVTKVYHKKGAIEAKGPRKIMYKSIHPVLDEAQAQGKECKLIDPRFHKENKRMNKEARIMQEAPNKRAARTQEAPMVADEAMDME